MEQLLSLGFPEAQCRHFLEQANGDVGRAVDALLANPEWEPPPAPAPRPPPAALSEFRVGQEVEYLSSTYNEWIGGKVLTINADGTLDLDVREAADPSNVRVRHVGLAPPHEAVAPGLAAVPEYGARGSYPWTRGSFVGEFCDCFIDNTDLEGGQSAPALVDLAKYLGDALNDAEQTPLLRAHSDSVQWVRQQLRGAAELDGDSRDGSRNAAVAFRDRLSRLRPGDMLTFCGGWLKPPQGHAIMYSIERTSAETFAWVIINTGEATSYHPSSWHYDRDESAAGPRRRCRTAVRIEGIAADKLLDEVVFYFLRRLRAYMHELHTPAVVYEVLVPYLTGDKTFLEAWAAGEREHPQLQGDFETLQSKSRHVMIMLASGLHSSDSANNLVAGRGGDVLLPVRAVRDEVPAQAEGRAQGRHQAADLRHPTEVRRGKNLPQNLHPSTLHARSQAQSCAWLLRISLLLRKSARSSRLTGLSLADEKRFGFCRQGIESHLNVPVLDESHHRLIQIACQQTALASWKERRAVSCAILSPASGFASTHLDFSR